MNAYDQKQDSRLSQLDESLLASHFNKILEQTLDEQILKDIQDFDDAAIPPKLEYAELHQKCSTFGMPIDKQSIEKIKICPCCCNIETKKYPLCTSSKQLTNYGPVIPLFFQYIHFLMLIMILFSGLGAVGEYYVVKANCSYKSHYKYDRCGINLATLVDSSLRNKREGFYMTISWINLAFMIFCEVLFYCFARMHLKLAEDIEKGRVSPADYTVMVYDIGPEEGSTEYLQSVVASLLSDDQKPLVDVVKVNVGKFEGNLVRIDNEIESFTRSLQAAERLLTSTELSAAKSKIIQKKIDSGRAQIEALVKKRKRYEEMIQNEPSFKQNSIAFVTFLMQDQAKLVAHAQSRMRQLKRIVTRFFWCCAKKKVHYIRRADEPDDIKWKFIGYTRSQRMITLVISYAITFAIIICSFGLQFAIRYTQKTFLTSANDEGTTWTNSIRVQGLQLLSSAMIGIFNKLLASITLQLSRYEKHLTTSQFLTSHTKKLILFQVMNSAGCAVFLFLLP